MTADSAHYWSPYGHNDVRPDTVCGCRPDDDDCWHPWHGIRLVKHWNNPARYAPEGRMR